MKNIRSTLFLLTFMSVFLSTSACSQDKNEQDNMDESTAEEVKAQMDETYDVMADFLYENKEEIIKNATNKIDMADQEIEKLDEILQTEINSISKEVKANKEKAIAELKEKRSILKSNIDSIQMSTNESWNDIKSGFIDAYGELENAFQDAQEAYTKSE